MEKNDYQALLVRQLSGELSPAEEAVLAAWLAESPDHRALAAQMRQIWDGAAEAPAVPALDLDADYQRVLARIEAGQETPRLGVAWRRAPWLRVAAAVALLLAGVWGIRQVMTQPAAVSQQELTADAGVRELTLPDGSRVWLRQHAVIQYPTSFDNSAARTVRLSGEAYFEVTHRPDQPFRVETTAGDRVEVLGTAFGVALSPNREKTEVLVRSGRVRFIPSGTEKSVELTARQKAAYSRASAQLLLDRDASLNALAWQAGGLEFVRTPLATVITDLEQYYGVNIILQNDALRNCRHTAPLTNQPLDKVLDGLALTYQLEVVSLGADEYVLKGGTCQ